MKMPSEPVSEGILNSSHEAVSCSDGSSWHFIANSFNPHAIFHRSKFMLEKKNTII